MDNEAMVKNHSVLLVGGPDAGKTNFLARLWLTIHNRSGRLHADGLPNDLEYLQEMARYLLSGKFAPRTQSEVPNRVEIPVKDAKVPEGLRGVLMVPDCSGEEWMKIYHKREWSEIWENIISDVSGCLLFVRVDSNQITPSVDWLTCATLFPDSPANEQVSPTQVVMVDWLQCLRHAFTECAGGSFLPRIGVMVAAYDRLPDDQKESDPGEYLHTNFPMLWQFIQTNNDRFDFATFGLSVTGGDLENEPGFRENYLSRNPQDAGYVVLSLNNKVEKFNDLTLPVAWAMGLEIESVR